MTSHNDDEVARHNEEMLGKLRRLVRKQVAKTFFGDPPDSTWYLWISQGLIPPPVKLGSLRRSVSLWDVDELLVAQQKMIAEREQRIAARNAGRTPEEIYGDVKPAPAAPEGPPAKSAPPPLTPAKAAQSERDARVAALWREGRSKKEIGRECGISTERIRQILAKAGARDRDAVA
jgi:hypothetical protein